MFEATNGPNWDFKLNWLTDQPLDEWTGVSTDGDGCVVSLDLVGNGLTGGIPAELGNLSELETLWMSHNELSGRIPPEMGNLSNLMYLQLDDNQLNGEIPAELGNLASLEFDAPSYRTGVVSIFMVFDRKFSRSLTPLEAQWSDYYHGVFFWSNTATPQLYRRGCGGPRRTGRSAQGAPRGTHHQLSGGSVQPGNPTQRPGRFGH